MQTSDLVAETTSATSCATITLLGAITGFRTFAAAFTVGTADISICVKNSAGSFETGLYTLSNATTLTRTSILSSSNGGAAVTFPVGSKDVNCTIPAKLFDTFLTNDAATVTTVADTAASKLPVIVGGVQKLISLDDHVKAISAPAGDLPDAGTPQDADIITLNRAGSELRTTWGALKATTGGAAADTTSPVLTSPTSASTGSTTGSGSVTTSEGNGTLYWLASTSASATAAAVKAGSSVAVTSTGSKAITVSGLTAATAYYIHYLHRDAAGNDSTIAISASFTTAATADTTAPTLTSPAGTQTGQNTATATVSTNEANGTLYYMASTNAVESATTVKAGASQPVTATGVQNVAFAGLTAATTYYSHFLHRDAAGNDSTVANGPGFTTASAAPAYTYTRSSPAGNALLPVVGKTTLTAVAVGAGVYNSFAATATNLLDAAYSFGVSPVPPNGVWLGAGTSNVTPPPLAPESTSATSSTMKVAGGKLLKATTGTAFTNGQYYSHPGFLFQEGIPGAYNWYYWIVTSDGVALCLNPNSPIVITLTAS